MCTAQNNAEVVLSGEIKLLWLMDSTTSPATNASCFPEPNDPQAEFVTLLVTKDGTYEKQ